MAVDIHCAKIAGRHIFWHAPFVAPLEGGQAVLDAPPGTLLYWPERQFLELIYGDLQAESAQVSVLGRLTGPVDWLAALGKRVIARHGHESFEATLSRSATPPATLAPTAAPAPPCAHAQAAQAIRGWRAQRNGAAASQTGCALLRQARAAAWARTPDCLKALAARRGILLPYGPLAMAEGEFRKLQELLWRLRDQQPPHFAATAAFLIDAFLTRIVGLCGLGDSGDVLALAADLLRHAPADAPAVLEDTILYCGRMAAWLDLAIPWYDLNAAVLRSQAAQDADGGAA